MSKSMLLKVVSAIVVAGDIVRRDEIVEVSASEGRDLLRRGKCAEPTADELAELSSAQTGVTRSGTEDPPENPEITEFNAGAAEGAAEAAAEVDAEPEAPAAADTPAPRRGRRS